MGNDGCWPACCELLPGPNNFCIPPHGNVDGTILVLGIAPGDRERELRQFFVGPTGQEVYNLLREVGIPENQCAFSNVYHRQPPKKNGKQTDPTAAMIKLCMPQLVWLIERMKNLKVIIALGGLVSGLLAGRKKVKKCRGIQKEFSLIDTPKHVQEAFAAQIAPKIDAVSTQIKKRRSKVRGSWEEEVQVYDHVKVAQYILDRHIYVVPTFHPAYHLRNENKERFLSVEDFQLAKDLADDLKLREEYAHSTTLCSVEDVCEHLQWLLDNKDKIHFLSVDIETDDKNFELAKRILCIGMTHEVGKAWIIPIAHPQWTFPNEELAKILPLLKKVLATLPIVGANFSFDWGCLWDHLDIKDINLVFDVVYASAYIFTGTRPSDLETIITTMTDAPNHKAKFHRYVLEHRKLCDPDDGGNYGNVPPEILFPYCGGDVDGTLRGAYVLVERLRTLGAYQDFIRHKIRPLRGVVEQSVNGLAIDEMELKKTSRELTAKVDHMRKMIQKTAPVKKFLAAIKDSKVKKEEGVTEYNHNAHWQTNDIIFKYGGVPKDVADKTKSGGASTGKESLLKILVWCSEQEKAPEGMVAFIEQVTELKTTDKLLNSYVDPLKKWIRGTRTNERPYAMFSKEYHPNTVHPSFYFGDSASTGRAKAKDPPLHSLTGIAKRPFVSRYGKRGLLLVPDEKQLEIRVLAMLTQDPALREVIQSGKDPHSMSATKLYGVTLEEVTKQMRQASKTGNFAVIYQKSPKLLAADMGFTLEAVYEVFETYFSTYTYVKPWMDRIRLIIGSQKDSSLPRVETPYGHWRVLPIVNDRDKGQIAERERKAINFMVQGTAALICHHGIFEHLAAYLRTMEYTKLTFQVHDSAVLDTVPQEIHDVYWNAKRCMEREIWEPWFSGIPIEADFKVGFNWCDTCKMEGYVGGYLLSGYSNIVSDVATFLSEENGWTPTLIGMGKDSGKETAEVFLSHNLPIPDLTPRGLATS